MYKPLQYLTLALGVAGAGCAESICYETTTGVLSPTPIDGAKPVRTWECTLDRLLVSANPQETRP